MRKPIESQANGTLPVLIAGGGIGGLTAALALQRAGIAVRVFEQAPAPREVGSGITLWSNAITVLRKLGLEGAIRAAGVESRHFDILDAGGRTLAVTDLAGLTARLGAPSICLHRADLLAILVEAVGTETIECGRRLVGFEPSDDEVSVRFEDGGTEAGSLLVGADGVHSAVRSQLHGPALTTYRGYTCWRGVSSCEPESFPPGQAREVWASGSRIGLLHCAPGKVFFYVTTNTIPDSPDPPGQRLATLLKLTRGWPDPTTEVLEAMDPAAVLRHDIADRRPLWTWGRGPVTLLGDAAHPMTPNWGQGACQAMEDAWVLAAELSRGVEAGALRRYERRRRMRAAWVVWNSWYIGYLGQLEFPPARFLRDALVRIAPWTTTFEFERMLRRGIENMGD